MKFCTNGGGVVGSVAASEVVDVVVVVVVVDSLVDVVVVVVQSPVVVGSVVGSFFHFFRLLNNRHFKLLFTYLGSWVWAFTAKTPRRKVANFIVPASELSLGPNVDFIVTKTSSWVVLTLHLSLVIIMIQIHSNYRHESRIHLIKCRMEHF